MEKVYVVCWGSATTDVDFGEPEAKCGVYGVYSSKLKAVESLVEYKDQICSEIEDNPDFNVAGREPIAVYGSAEEGYFRIHYYLDDIPYEIYITIEEKELN